MFGMFHYKHRFYLFILGILVLLVGLVGLAISFNYSILFIDKLPQDFRIYFGIVALLGAIGVLFSFQTSY